MNKKLICLLMFVFSLSLAFTACSDDDDDKVDYAKEVAGTYNGKLTIQELGNLEVPNNDIVLSRVADNKVKLSLTEIKLVLQEGANPISIKNIAINNVPVTKSSDTYSLAKTTEKITINVLGADIQADVAVEGTVKSGKSDLKIIVSAVPGFDNGLNISFSGTKK